MKISKVAKIGLIFGILLILGFSIVPVSATDDTSWFQPAPFEDVIAWFNSQTHNLWAIPAVPGDSTGAFPVTTPSYIPSDNTAWYTPAPPEQAIAWGQRLSAQTTYPSTLSQAERIRLFKSYNNNGFVPLFPTVTVTSVPATQPAFPPYYNPITFPPTPYYIPSTAPTAYPTQVPITFPPTPYYIPSIAPTAYPTLSPTSGGVVVPGQNTGVSLAELNLQGKYVRITNSGPTPVVMTGWKITNSQGNALNFIDFPLGGGATFTYVLNPYATITVFFGREGMVSGSELYYPYGVDFWNQQGDTASLYNPQGQLVGRISA
jgi:hypothetical protein